MTRREKAIAAAKERIRTLRSEGADISVSEAWGRVEIEHRLPADKRGRRDSRFEIIRIPSE